MSDPGYYNAPGNPAAIEDFQSQKAEELALLLQDDEASPHTTFIEARLGDDRDIVVVEVEPEVPQDPVHDIRTVECIAVVFDHNDEDTPEPLALRKDFPVTLHQNLIVEGEPRSLCLHEEPYQERRVRWTASRFVRRLREWLAQAARGGLHPNDQSLERLFLGTPHRIVLPSTFYSDPATETPDYLSVAWGDEVNGGWSLIAKAQLPDQDGEVSPFVGITYDAAPRKHGRIRVQPASIADLDRFLENENFLHHLRERLLQLEYNGDRPFTSKLVIVLRIPKLREGEDSPDAFGIWAFMTNKDILEIGKEIGAWRETDDGVGRCIPFDDTKRGENIGIGLLNPTQALTTGRAAKLTGVEPNQNHHIAVGMGTLGSQVFMNLARTGYGTWTLLDKDVLLPHNAPRHYLDGRFVGVAKSTSMNIVANSLFERPIAHRIVDDVLSADEEERIDEAYEQAHSILDMSASVAVARHLALDIDCQARRSSLFLSPDGRDLVLLAEPSDRSLRLDQLEMEYYRALVENEELSEHLLMNGERLRYGQSCRDVSSELPQDLAALHSGVGARAYRSLESDSSVRFWRAGEDMNVKSISIDARDHHEFDVGEWTVSVSAPVIEEMKEQRQARLPNETGGVLFGVFDTERSRVYVIGVIPAPPDSEEWPDAYIRGVEGLQDRLEEISDRTGGQVEYVGEWHSHPPDTDTGASEDDENLFDWLTEHRKKDGLPAVMAIQGSGDTTRWFVESLSENYELSTPGI